MTARQLDLFSGGAGSAAHRSPRARTRQETLAPASLDDAALIEAIPDAGIANAPELAAEAGRRRLAAAATALERLCRQSVGFGSDRTIPEQLAAVEALATIGGPPARQAIVRIIASRIVQGPGLVPAIAAAVHLGADLPTDPALDLLRHPIPAFVLALADASAHRLRWFPFSLSLWKTLTRTPDMPPLVPSDASAGARRAQPLPACCALSIVVPIIRPV